MLQLARSHTLSTRSGLESGKAAAAVEYTDCCQAVGRLPTITEGNIKLRAAHSPAVARTVHVLASLWHASTASGSWLQRGST